MARRLPSSEGTLFLHSTLSFSLIAACIAASIAIFASLCATCNRKPSTTSPKSPSPDHNNEEEPTQVDGEREPESEQEEWDPPMSEERITELEAAIHGPIYPTEPAGSTSKRRISVSLSIGIKDGLSKIKTKKDNGKFGGREESLWKKTIILGEKCRMKSEEEGGEATSRRSQEEEEVV
ncbi:uncharacterized protein A4U43_C06F9920 [Asparagus officinalis]|uniref:Uncharacterized protein n=1 Tax=Asparagus officinalis TaxID=4686 RepID=A0A5P1EKR7_ASPOF|nr:uncharacterized protein LOC109828539 [Asparagus officinalis]ONK66588.1 uncharacterized protein A4U43_C06F9920 [Asparagus officinalis]